MTILTGLTACLVLGVVAYGRMPLEMMPSGLTWPFLYVRIPYPSATPSEVERLIQEPVEHSLLELRGLTRITSWAQPTGVDFWLRFADGTDMTSAWLDTRERLERLRGSLPPDAGRFVVWKYNPQDMPVMVIGVGIARPPEDLAALIEERVTRRLQRLPGVAMVEAAGVRAREVRVTIDETRAQSHGLTLFEVGERLARDGFALASGVLQATGPEGAAGRRLPVRGLAPLDDLDVLRAWPAAPGVRLADVADVAFGRADADGVLRVGGRPGVTLDVFRESGGNAVALSHAVADALAHLSADDAVLARAGVTFTVLYDEGAIVRAALGGLAEALAYGGVFALIVILVFLRRVVLTLVLTASIPLTLTMTLVALFLAGYTLNVLTLLGLTLAVGMVVDNAIVVVESIDVRRRRGEPAHAAALAGTADVAMPVLASTATTVVAFLPLVWVGGNSTFARYVAEVAFPVCFALSASLVTALVLIPLATAWLPVPAAPLDEGAAAARGSATTALGRHYERLLAWTLTHRVKTTLLVLVLVASTALPYFRIRDTDRTPGALGDFTLRLAVPRSQGLAEAGALLERIDAAILARREALGLREVVSRYEEARRLGRVRVFLDADADTGLHRAEVVEAVRRLVPEVPGLDVRLGWHSGPAGDDTVRLYVRGQGSAVLRALADEATRRLRALPEVLSVEHGEGYGGDEEIRLHVARDMAERLGVSPVVVAGTVAYSLRGRQARTLQVDGHALPLRVVLREDDRRDARDLAGMPLPGTAGAPVSAVARPTVAPGFAAIRHENGATVVELTATTATDDLARFYAAVDAALADMTWPLGATYDRGDRYDAYVESKQDLMLGVALGALIVFLLLGVLLESTILPLVIMLTVPLAFVGVYWLLWATGTPADDVGRVGYILLIGVVVNNAIVLMDLMVERRRRGIDPVAAARIGGTSRLRPVLMTALTTIFGLVPMALGGGGLGGLSFTPLGRVVIGGMVTSTALTLIVIPILYTYVEDARAAFARAREAVER